MNNGYFIDEKKEYVITNMYPKRPLMNYIWNEQEFMVLDQFGFGPCSIFDEKREQFELYSGTGDLYRANSDRVVYVMDRSSGEYYAANRNYGKLPFDKHCTHVGQGYSVIVSEYKGLRVEFKIFAPIVGRAECWEIKLINTSAESKALSVYPNANVKASKRGNLSYLRAEYDTEFGGLYSTEEVYKLGTEITGCFMASDREVLQWDVAKQNFIGFYGAPANPVALENGGELSCKGIDFEPNCAFVMRHDIELEPSETQIIRVIVGMANDKAHALQEKKRLLNEAAFAQNLEELRRRADMYDENVTVDTGNETINRFANIWLKRQIEFGKTWARGFSVGSRDLLQDIASFVSLDADISREKLIYAMQFVRPNGNILRSLVPAGGDLAHDCSTWMISSVCQYIKESGDYSILDVDCPYYKCDEHGTVLDHLMRASRFLLDGVGSHGLTLWGEIDWNDSLNGAGRNLIGESLWLSEASVKSGRDFAELLERIGMHELAEAVSAKCDRMKENIIKHGWEGDHFIYGINDWGEKVGSYDCSEGKSYLNPQTWAVLAGILPEDKLNTLMDYVEKNLSCDFGYVQNVPAYTKGDDHIGRVTYFQKGCYENGSVYNHGCAFKLAADCYLHRGNEALDTVLKMLPTNPKNDSSVSGVEPYALSNMYLGPENDFHPGYSPMYWVTGTCGWMFRGIVEYMLGVQAEYDGLKINPSLPEAWKKASVHRTYRGCVYDITFIQNTYNGQLSITVDGEKLSGNLLPIFTDGKAHEVIVTIG